MIKKIVKSLLLVLVAAYVGLMVFGCSMVNKMIFHPPPAQYTDNGPIIKIKTASGRKVSVVHLKNLNSVLTILYSHGNAEDLGTVIYKLKYLYDLGFSVVGYDYGGYGTSEGVPTEKNVNEDIQAVYDYIKNELNTPGSKIVAYGFSLGGGASTDLASKNQIGGLILESTFVSAFRVVTHYKILPIDKFESLMKIKNIKCPVLIMHGNKDMVIKDWHGKKLYDQANQPKIGLWVHGAGHGDIPWIDKDGYIEAINKFKTLVCGV